MATTLLHSKTQMKSATRTGSPQGGGLRLADPAKPCTAYKVSALKQMPHPLPDAGHMVGPMAMGQGEGGEETNNKEQRTQSSSVNFLLYKLRMLD